MKGIDAYMLWDKSISAVFHRDSINPGRYSSHRWGSLGSFPSERGMAWLRFILQCNSWDDIEVLNMCL